MSFMILNQMHILKQIFKPRQTSSSSYLFYHLRTSKRYLSLPSSPYHRKTMDSLEITDFKVVPCVDSKFIVPTRLSFKQNGVQRKWDYVKSHDSVAVLIYNSTQKSFVLVKQFRPALYINKNSKANKEDGSTVKEEDGNITLTAPFQQGVSYELCAGIVDQKRSLEEIAQSEVMEETGYDVPLSNLTKLFIHHGVGPVANRMTIYYAEVTDAMKTSKGGGLHELGEFIELYHLPLHEAKDFVFNDNYSKPSGAVAAFLWFFMEKKVKFD